jgi:hypothetical protein
LEIACRENGGTIENNECKRPEAPAATDKIEAAKLECDQKGDAYRWDKDRCRELPKIKLIGELSSKPGLIWEATDTTCEKVVTRSGDRYTSCAGIDATIPLASIPETASNNTLVLVFNCDGSSALAVSLSIGQPSNVPNIGEGGRVFDQAFGTGTSTFTQTTLISAGNKATLEIKMRSTDHFEPFMPGCKIELKENSASPAPL